MSQEHNVRGGMTAGNFYKLFYGEVEVEKWNSNSICLRIA